MIDQRPPSTSPGPRASLPEGHDDDISRAGAETMPAKPVVAPRSGSGDEAVRDEVAGETIARLRPVVARRYVRFRSDAGQHVQEPVIAEMRLRIEVDGVELVELMCSPHRVNALVLGFLYHEGIIDSSDDVAALRVCLPDGLAEVRLARPAPPLPTRRIVTSGCTGGVSFGAYLEEIDSLRLPPDRVRVEPARVYVALRQLYDHATLYNQSGGVHTSVLIDPASPVHPEAGILAVGEDIGRHNTLDKLRGEALLRDLPTRGTMIVSSGRISSEMLLKAALMGVPLVGSRTSPTGMAITLGEHLGLTVIGYIRSSSMNVYTHAHRVVGAPSPE
ncbi:MAG: formate dehydrogenase accessory sulfurtransferase FdhD [Chloroflexi bacterium]|nr:formate dehydrogenase accessory sulfurtransferase FdhD [Chloroflexota bacterium]